MDLANKTPKTKTEQFLIVIAKTTDILFQQGDQLLKKDTFYRPPVFSARGIILLY